MRAPRQTDCVRPTRYDRNHHYLTHLHRSTHLYYVLTTLTSTNSIGEFEECVIDAPCPLSSLYDVSICLFVCLSVCLYCVMFYLCRTVRFWDLEKMKMLSSVGGSCSPIRFVDCSIKTSRLNWIKAPMCVLGTITRWRWGASGVCGKNYYPMKVRGSRFMVQELLLTVTFLAFLFVKK